jgi:hypothetical protein
MSGKKKKLTPSNEVAKPTQQDPTPESKLDAPKPSTSFNTNVNPLPSGNNLTSPAPLPRDATKLLLLTPKLKQLAKEANKAWSAFEPEDLHAHNCQSLGLKFTTTETAQKALAAIKIYTDTIKSAAFKSLNPLPNSPVKDTICISWEYFLPVEFGEVLDDVEKTNLDKLPVKAHLLDEAEKYVAIFSAGNFIRPVFDHSVEIPEDIHAAEAYIEQLHKIQHSCLNFIRELIEAAKRKIPTTISIDAQLTIRIDGVVQKLKPTPKKALFTLALFRNQTSFPAKDFVMLYAGKNTGTDSKDFYNAIESLKACIPTLTFQSAKGSRTVEGIQWKGEFNEQIIRKHLSP